MTTSGKILWWFCAWALLLYTQTQRLIPGCPLLRSKHNQNTCLFPVNASGSGSARLQSG